MKPGIKVYQVRAPALHKECKQYASETCINKLKNILIRLCDYRISFYLEDTPTPITISCHSVLKVQPLLCPQP